MRRAALMLLSMLAVSAARGGPPASRPSSLDRFPPKLREFAARIEAMESAEAAARDALWREVYRARFDEPDRRSLRVVRPEEARHIAELADRIIRFDRLDGRAVLRFDVTDFQQGLLAIGPEVSGEFAIEFVGASISQRQCDLSVFCGDTSSGTGFQFGAYDNTRNLLLVGLHEEDGETGSLNMDVAADQLLERGRRYRVRLEVIDGEVRGLVDGSLVGRARLGNRYDATKPRQPMLYAYASEVAIEEFRVFQADRSRLPATQPTTLPSALEQDLQRLAELLDDEDFRVREMSAELLRRAGERAVPVLKRMQGTGSLERQDRVRELLLLINPEPRFLPRDGAAN